MTPTFTVDGSPLPLPRADSPWDLEYIPFGSAARSANATLRVQFMGVKYRVKINWTGLLAAERNSLFSIYQTYIQTSGVWVFPDGLSFRGTIPLVSWVESHWMNPHNSIFYYDVNFTVEQT